MLVKKGIQECGVNVILLYSFFYNINNFIWHNLKNIVTIIPPQTPSRSHTLFPRYSWRKRGHNRFVRVSDL